MNAAVEVGRDESLLLSFAAGEGSPNLSRSGMRALLHYKYITTDTTAQRWLSTCFS